jgi:hypothetical protein
MKFRFLGLALFENRNAFGNKPRNCKTRYNVKKDTIMKGHYYERTLL